MKQLNGFCFCLGFQFLLLLLWSWSWNCHGLFIPSPLHLRLLSFPKKPNNCCFHSASQRRQVSSETKWNDLDNLIEAAQIYHEVYKDGRINTQFVIPSKPPWPGHLHGLKLGRRLKFALSEGFDDLPPAEFSPEQTEKIKLLKPPHLNITVHSDWEVLYSALLIYKDIYGDIKVKTKFVVPDADPWPPYTRQFKLGLHACKTRQFGGIVFGNIERMDALAELGFDWAGRKPPSLPQENSDEDVETSSSQEDFTQKRFNFLYEALKVYRKIHGNVLVPDSFVVPSDSEWPSKFWGTSLGVQVRGIRNQGTLVAGKQDRKELLQALGFTFHNSKPKKKNVRLTNNGKESIDDDHSVFNDDDDDDAGAGGSGIVSWEHHSSLEKAEKRVDRNMVMKQMSPGGKISVVGRKTLTKSDADNEAEEMEYFEDDDDNDNASDASNDSDELGFDDDDDDDGDDDDDESNNDDDDERNLGNMVDGDNEAFYDLFEQQQQREKEKRLLNQKYFDEKMDEIRHGQFLDFPEMTIDVGRMFEVDEEREKKAGAILQEIAQRQHSKSRSIRKRAAFEGIETAFELNQALNKQFSEEDIQAMKKLGYRLIEFGRFRWESVLKALRTYKEIHGHLNVPLDFELSKEVLRQYPEFNRSSYTMKLGGIVESIRIGDVDGYEDEERRKQLDQLGFDWGNIQAYQRFRFPALFLGLRVFFIITGSMVIRSEFVVPDAGAWPYWMIGMPLGLWSAIARVQRPMLEKYFPDRKKMLDELNFMWWLPPGKIPATYFEPLQ